MSLQYGRIIEVHIAGLKITEPRIDFETYATADDLQNRGEVRIYNLSRERHDQISKSGEKITIFAGYRGTGSAHILTGVVQKIWKTRRINRVLDENIDRGFFTIARDERR